MNLKREIKNIPISSIRPNPYQPRKLFNQKALEELSKSIKTFGVIQPISVRRISMHSFELVAGERRLRASEMADLTEVPAIIMNFRDKESALIALVENLQREDLNFIEEAEGYNNLINDHHFTQSELAEKLGKSQSSIANKLRLLRLPADIKRTLIEENLTERHGRALLKLPDDNLRRVVLEKTINNDLNVSGTEAVVEDILESLRRKENLGFKQNMKSMISIRIYLNTIKKAYKAIKEYGIQAEYGEEDKGDYILVSIKVPKAVGQ